jgi:ABC-type transport system involved in cytochrome c biogenesis ATPase subunit
MQHFWEMLEGGEGRTTGALETMGLGHLAQEQAVVLSMGQRKRLQLARMLAVPRPLWLLDEPSVGLDAEVPALLNLPSFKLLQNLSLIVTVALYCIVAIVMVLSALVLNYNLKLGTT